MPTDNDRREVARRLREYVDLPDDWWADTYSGFYVEKCAFGNVERHRESELFARLADLIEPESERTCRVESSHEEESDGCYSYFEYELTCGHEIAWGDQLPPSYCPECGRRVLYDSDDYI